MPPHRRIAIAGLALSFALAFTAFRPPSTPGPLERDFEAYFAAGAIRNAGDDPYSRAIWNVERRIPGVNAGRDELLPFVGPAAALPFWSLLARLPYREALAAWSAILVGSLVAVLAAGLRLARATRDPYLYLVAAALTIASAPTIASLALGQAALVSAAAIAIAVVAYGERRPAGAFLATLAAALQPNLACALVARVRSRWDAAVAASAAATFAILTLAAGGGVAGFAAYLRHLAAHGAAERYISIQHTPAAIAFAWGVPAQYLPAASAVLALGTVAITAGVIVREHLDAATATLVACALLPLALPFFHQPDFVLEVLPILILALTARGRARSLASVAAVLVLVDWFGLAQRHGAQGQIVSLGFAVAFAFLGLRGSATRERGPDFAAPIAMAALAAIAIPLSRAHVSPTWPDMLPAGYHADPSADASAVWGAEQRAAGLDARDPAWGVLRGFPLAGCVVLAGALVADARQRRAKHCI